METSQLPQAAPVPMLSRPHSKKVFPDAQVVPAVFWVVSVASGPGTGHH